jgi:hypothetical protein
VAVRHKTYHSTISFLDLFLNTLLGFVFLFLISWLLINPVAKNKTVDAKGEFVITINWPDKNTDDVDLWIKHGDGTPIYYGNKENTVIHLDRDDLGISNDTIILADGSTKVIPINREIATIRGISPGEYIINIHMFSKRDKKDTPVDIEVVKVNPFRMVDKKTITLTTEGQEETVIRFTVDAAGEVENINDLPQGIRKHYNGVLPGRP